MVYTEMELIYVYSQTNSLKLGRQLKHLSNQRKIKYNDIVNTYITKYTGFIALSIILLQHIA